MRLDESLMFDIKIYIQIIMCVKVPSIFFIYIYITCGAIHNKFLSFVNKISWLVFNVIHITIFTPFYFKVANYHIKGDNFYKLKKEKLIFNLQKQQSFSIRRNKQFLFQHAVLYMPLLLWWCLIRNIFQFHFFLTTVRFYYFLQNIYYIITLTHCFSLDNQSKPTSNLVSNIRVIIYE